MEESSENNISNDILEIAKKIDDEAINLLLNDTDISSDNNNEISTTMLQRKLSPKKYKKEIELVIEKVEDIIIDINFSSNTSPLIRRLSSSDTTMLEKTNQEESHNDRLNKILKKYSKKKNNLDKSPPMDFHDSSVSKILNDRSYFK